MRKNLRETMLLELEQQALLKQAKDYALDYMAHVLERGVFPEDDALVALSVFDQPLPELSCDPAQLLQQLHQYGSPATVAQTGGRYFGLVNGGVLPVALASRWLADVWDQNTPLYVTSPIVAKLEAVSEGWLKQLLGLPAEVVAGFVSGSSMATFCALAAARYRILARQGWDVNQHGLNGAPAVRVVASTQAHGTVLKAIALLGLGVGNVEWVEADPQGCIQVGKIPRLDANTVLLLQAGNVNSGAFDNFSAICKDATTAGAWVHVDGAFGLWAAASTQLNHLTQGIEWADSWSVDGHKTLNTPYDNGMVLCRDRDALMSALQASASYIPYSEQRDGMLYTAEMSRRARVVELWAALKYLGRSGLDELVSGLHRRALQFAAELQRAGFEILNEVVFNQVLVGCDTDKTTTAIIEYIQASRECWVGGAIWKGRRVIRISVCSWATTRNDISRSVRAFVAARQRAIKPL